MNGCIWREIRNGWRWMDMMDGDENLRGGWWEVEVDSKQRERKIDSKQTKTETQSWIYNGCQLAV